MDSGATAQYLYNAEGHRIRKIAGGTTVDYIYDTSGNQIAEFSSTGSWNRGEVYAGGHHVATYASNTTYFIHADWLGSERARSSASGAPFETCTSLPFGDWLSCAGSDPSPMHLTGKERDSESGLDYFGARYYSSTVGRFVSGDTGPYRWSDPQTLNRYIYTRNNPLRFVDPSGKYFVISTSDSHYGEFKEAIAKMLLTPEGSKAVQQIAVSPKPVFYQSGNLGTTQRGNSTTYTVGDTKIIETTKPASDGSHLVGVSSGAVVTVDFQNASLAKGQIDVTVGHETSHVVNALAAGDSFLSAIAAAQAGDAPSHQGANDTLGGPAEQFGQATMTGAVAATMGVGDDVLEQVSAEAQAIIESGNAQCQRNSCNQTQGNQPGPSNTPPPPNSN